MANSSIRTWALALGGLPLLTQGLPSTMDLQALRQAAGGATAVVGGDAIPRSNVSGTPGESEGTQFQRQAEEERLDSEIRQLKRREKGPRRFAADLFEVRQRGTASTEGGVSEDYVLGVGDRLQLNVFGSATFEIPVQVDGKGEVVIPKVGTAKVAGRTLAQAKQVVQGLVGRNFSRSTAELQVVKLREVRVFVMGEVYKPGAYLVSSLSSLVNVLSLAGGPTAVGSYRDIRVMRGGKRVFSLDLYPFRAEGLGNPNYSLQSGDTLFVPFAQHLVTLEGAFSRVALGLPTLPDTSLDPSPKGRGLSGDGAIGGVTPEEEELGLYRTRLQREVRSIEDRLGEKQKVPSEIELIGGSNGRAPREEPKEITPKERQELEDRLYSLRKQLNELRPPQAGEQRVSVDPRTKEPLLFQGKDDRPLWLAQWEDSGVAPSMLFEVRPGETAADLASLAGGLLVEAGEGTLALRRRSAAGSIDGQVISMAAAKTMPLQRGDTLSALPRREVVGRVVTLAGWVRVPGPFARTEGLRISDLLKREQQLLPDTYRARAEVVRTPQDGRSRLLAFDVDKAMAGEPAHDLLLQDRDRVELFRQRDLRLPQTVRVMGPLTRPGLFPWHEGMRASDLLFRAGIPKKSANRLVGELARTKDGRGSDIHKLDLTRLLSTESTSPVALLDEAVNPLLSPDDQLSVYEKPGFRIHRVVRLSGQVARPGDYALDVDEVSLRQVLERAGGLTPEAMPRAGIFLRKLAKADSSLHRAAEESGLSSQDPAAKGVNEILQRLNETKRQPITAQIQQNPVLHGLATGSLNRLVVNFEAALKGEDSADVELQDGDEIIIPHRTQAAYVVGETASPFGAYKVPKDTSVKELLKLAGGTTRNADTRNIRLLKADGRIIDGWISGHKVEPGDTVLVPQRIRRDSSWQENLNALTPLALILNAVK